MSQRPSTTVSTIGTAGMPIFQSSGLVPLHNTTYSMPPMSSHSKAAQPSLSGVAASSAVSSHGRLSEIPISRFVRPTESSGLSSSGSPALAKLLQTANPRSSDRNKGRGNDRVQPGEDRLEGSQDSARDFRFNSSHLSAIHDNPFVAKQPALGVDYPNADIHSAADTGANPPAGWLSQAQTRVFRPVANTQAMTSVDRKASPGPHEPTARVADYMLRASEHVLRAEERTVGADDQARGSRSDLSDGRCVTSIKRDNDADPVKTECDTKEWQTEKMEKDEEEEEGSEEWVTMDNNPFNMRIVNLSNFPVTQSVYRTNYRTHSVACGRAKLGSIQNTAKSLDLLRQILQKSINVEIDVIIKKYLADFFQPALENIRLNNGDNAVSNEHVNNVCRQILEEAKKMFHSDTRSTTPDLDNASDSGSTDDVRIPRQSRGSIPPRKRKMSSGSESSSYAPKTKKKGRFAPHLQTSSGRSTPSKKLETVRREGPLWDSERIKPDTLFVMGAKANKALGLGATRGRIYIKHPEVFKYCGDQDDKQWLYEKHLMPATGGKTYLLIVDDIRELAQSDEYRNSPGLLLDELVGFTAPEWMLEKMRSQMNAMRTDTYKGSHILRESTTTESLPRPSPANSDIHEMSTEHDYEDDSRAVSPLNETGGFNQQPSPAPSQAPSELTNAEESDDEAPMPGSLYVA